MAKQPPILLVNKTARQSKRRTTRKASSTSKAGSRRRTRKRRAEKELPAWLRKLLLIGVATGVILACYTLFIRPYLYRSGVFEIPKETNVYFPAGYKVYGIDLSHYQGEVDWELMKKGLEHDSVKLSFVFVKATEGKDHLDASFQSHIRQARKHGYIVGAYHYFSLQSDPEEQADWYANNVNLYAGELPPVLDVEEQRGPEKAFRAAVLKWLKRIEKHYGVKPIIYTSYKFKERYLHTPAFDTYPFWIAHYYVRELSYKGKWHFWQHTDRGVVPGIHEDVDLNVFNGSLDDLKKLTIR